MILQVYDRYFGIQEFEISLIERLKLKLNGRIYAFHARKEGWNGEELPFYIAKCGKCGCYFLDYPHGGKEALLCPLCDEVARRGFRTVVSKQPKQYEDVSDGSK
jgi:hypothetical protein